MTVPFVATVLASVPDARPQPQPFRWGPLQRLGDREPVILAEHPNDARVARTSATSLARTTPNSTCR